jgi:hypothetical protein
MEFTLIVMEEYVKETSGTAALGVIWIGSVPGSKCRTLFVKVLINYYRGVKETNLPFVGTAVIFIKL